MTVQLESPFNLVKVEVNGNPRGWQWAPNTEHSSRGSSRISITGVKPGDKIFVEEYLPFGKGTVQVIELTA